MKFIRPNILPRWATEEEIDLETGQSNVIEPPESQKNVGFRYKAPPPRNWINWLFKTIYESIGYCKQEVDKHICTNGEGKNLFPAPNCLVVLYGVNKVDPSQYIHALGYRSESNLILNIVSSNALHLGEISSCDASVQGAPKENILLYGISQY